MTAVYAQSAMTKNEIKLLRLHQNKLAPCRSGTRWIEMFGGLAFFFPPDKTRISPLYLFLFGLFSSGKLRSWIEPLEKPNESSI